MTAVAVFSREQGAESSFPSSQFITSFFFIQSLLLRSAVSINCSEPTTDGLLTALKENIFYKTDVRPVLNLKTPTNINVSFTLYGILDMDEKAQTFESFIWMYLFWHIEGLSWDPEECGTDRISLPRKQLWRPDIVINEFMDENKAPTTYYLYVLHTGKVMDDVPIHVISSCNLDIYTFPFDIQNCSLSFNSYQHTAIDIRMFFQEPVEATITNSKAAMKTKGEWDLVTMFAEKKTVPPEKLYEDYDVIIYYIVLRRRPTMYVVNLLIPSCFLITVDLFSFLLPPQSVDRSAFKMTLILGYTVFLLLMNDLLPVTGNTLPLINVFFSLCLALMVASLLETIVIINIQCGASHYGPLPRWAKVLFLKYLSRLVFLHKQYIDTSDPEEEKSNNKSCDHGVEALQTESDLKPSPSLQELRKINLELISIHHQIDKHLQTDQTEDEWELLAQVIDRLLFLLYIAFLLVSFFTIMVVWFHWYHKTASLIDH